MINIANDFTRHPGGRFYSDGPHSGEEFREAVLRPLLNKDQQCTIIFDGARGYGSSFLDEAFGGLIRLGYPIDKITSLFKFVSNDDPSVITEIMDYLRSNIPTTRHA